MIKKSPSFPHDWRHRRIYREAVCPVCREKFVSKYRGKEGWATYCSGKCASHTRRRGEYRKCETCGKAFYISRAHMRRGDEYERARFCSSGCFRVWRSTLRGAETPNWKGGRFIGPNGYVYIRVDNSGLNP